MRARDLKVRVRDLAFSVNAAKERIVEGGTLADIWEMSSENQRQGGHKPSLEDSLWDRARASGAWTPSERQEFGFADDMYSVGLLIVYMVFVSLSKPGSIDGPMIQRLIEGTFQSNVMEFREYSKQEEAWNLPVEFLDAEEGIGWHLLECLLNPDWRGRPSAASCLTHPFLARGTFEGYEL